MIYCYEYPNFEEGNDSILSQIYIDPNNIIPSSNILYSPNSDLPLLKDNKGIHSLSKENNKNNNYIFKGQTASPKIEKEQTQSNIIDIKNEEVKEKEKEKEKEIMFKYSGKVLFNVKDFLPTSLQTQKTQEKIEVNNNSLKVSKSENNNINITINIDNLSRKHKKLTDEKLRKKCKNFLLRHIREFINEKLSKIYRDKIGNLINLKQLLINKSNRGYESIDYNKKFMNKTLGEIYSEDISKRNSNYPDNKNKILIEQLTKEENEEKSRAYFQKIFNLSFRDCIEHFTGKKDVDILNGLKLLSDIINNPIKLKRIKTDFFDKDYLDNIEYYFKNYEELLNEKHSRKRKKR